METLEKRYSHNFPPAFSVKRTSEIGDRIYNKSPLENKNSNGQNSILDAPLIHRNNTSQTDLELEWGSRINMQSRWNKDTMTKTQASI